MSSTGKKQEPFKIATPSGKIWLITKLKDYIQTIIFTVHIKFPILMVNNIEAF
jgi:hypothetical protein